MNLIKLQFERRILRYLIAVSCSMLILPGNASLFASATPSHNAQATTKVPTDQLDSLVAPIALYPDSLLSQTLVASTYPLEIIQLQQWLDKNQDLAGNQQKLAEAVQKQ